MIQRWLWWTVEFRTKWLPALAIALARFDCARDYARSRNVIWAQEYFFIYISYFLGPKNSFWGPNLGEEGLIAGGEGRAVTTHQHDARVAVAGHLGPLDAAAAAARDVHPHHAVAAHGAGLQHDALGVVDLDAGAAGVADLEALERDVAGARKASAQKKRELAHACLWEHGCKRLELAHLLGRLGAFLT